MEREAMKNNGDGVCRTNPETTTTTDFVLQWGSRKRLRCMKIQVKKGESTDNRTTVRVDRRVVRTEKDSSNRATTISTNSRRLPPSSPPPPPSYRILRNSEPSCGMKGQSNGVRSSFSSLDRGDERAQDKKANNHNHSNSNHRNGDDHNNAVAGASASSETAHDIKKGNSSSGSDAIPVWPPKFVISLTNKEKEEDFLTFKGSKLPQRPKKRAKFIQRTLNLVCPGSWLCDLTLERYEVREKKISKKRPRGLKAMGNMDSESE